MRRQLAAFVASGGAFIASSGTPMAHHSFAMFDQENPIELVGTVQSSSTPVRTPIFCWRSRGRTAARPSGIWKAARQA
jgi:hypothetical protein